MLRLLLHFEGGKHETATVRDADTNMLCIVCLRVVAPATLAYPCSYCKTYVHAGCQLSRVIKTGWVPEYRCLSCLSSD